MKFINVPNTLEVSLDSAAKFAKTLLTNLAIDQRFTQVIATAFENEFNTEKVERLRQAWATGDFSHLPEVEIRSSQEINRGAGAFSKNTNKIYLAEEFAVLHRNHTLAIADILLEETGHWVDAQINTEEAPGDEGAIFSALVRGKILDPYELQALKTENDHATVILDGEEIEIEQAIVSYSGDVVLYEDDAIPPDVSRYESPRLDGLQAFNEAQNIILSEDVFTNNPALWEQTLTPAIPSGTEVSSHYIWIAPSQDNRLRVTAQFTFDEPIVGFIGWNDELLATNDLLGLGNTIYSDLNTTRLDNHAAYPQLDDLATLIDDYTVEISFSNDSGLDPIRVLTSGNNITLPEFPTSEPQPEPEPDPEPELFPENVIRIEAEDLNLNNYVLESGDFASGGKLITLGSNGNIGSASHTWTGLGGEYELTIAYFNESDGASNATVKVDGVEVDSWTWNLPSSGTRPNAGNLETRTINVNLNSNSTIEVTGVRHTGENARLDYIEYKSLNSEPSNNNNPVATGDYYNVVEDNILSVAANAGVLSNDSDSDGDSLTLSNYNNTSTAGGSVNVNADGSLSYTPVPNFTGIDSFNYTVSDGNGGVDTATVTVEVTPENDAPKAVDDSYSLAKNTELTFDAISNDSDIDGDTLTIDDYDSASVAGGSVSLNGDGSLTYIPVANFTGNDSFTYSISDGQGGIDTATVNLTVNEVNTDAVRIEAENLTLNNYVEETGDFASGGKLITLGSNGDIGSASHSWTGLGGEYELTIAYFNESDGASNATVKVDGVEVDNWTWNQPSSGTRPNAGNLETRTINVDLNSGSTIEVIGVRHTGENARLDFLELTPVFTEADVTPPTASLDGTALTVSPGSNLNYNFTVTFTDEAGVDVSSLDSNDIQVTGPNGFSQTATLLSVAGNEATYQIQAPTNGWQEDNFGSYTVTVKPDEVSDINGNFITETVLGNFQVNVGETVSYAFSDKAVIARLDQDFVFTPEFEDTLEIMLLGDSITQGKVNNSEPEAEREGYRRFLWDALNDFGLEVDFVGSESNGKGGFDQDHQGHPGWKIQDLANGKSTTPNSGIDNWISAEQAQPDLVLAMAGTNNAGSSGSTIANYLDDLIGKIFDNPIFNGELIVSTIAPIHPNSSYYNSRLPNVIDYNALIPDVVESYANQGEDIHFVDIWSGDYAITENDMTVPPADNGLHPSVNGYYNMAQTFYNAILDAVGVSESANNVSNIIGSDLNDVIVGNNNSNEIVGGIGADELTGNDGADVFIYETANEGEDILTDFNASEGDQIQISASGFGGGLAAGVSLSDSLAAATGVFVSGSNPQPVGDSANFLYDSDSGVLSVDIDGEGVENAVTLATLTGAPALAFNDLIIA